MLAALAIFILKPEPFAGRGFGWFPFKALKNTLCRPGAKIIVESCLADPVEVSERLALEVGGERRTLERLEDLKGFVIIDTPSKALSFLRLKSAITTLYMWRGPFEHEIGSIKDVA